MIEALAEARDSACRLRRGSLGFGATACCHLRALQDEEFKTKRIVELRAD
jgi:hypothetical protein